MVGFEIIADCLRLGVDWLLETCDTNNPGQYIRQPRNSSPSAIPAVVLYNSYKTSLPLITCTRFPTPNVRLFIYLTNNESCNLRPSINPHQTPLKRPHPIKPPSPTAHHNNLSSSASSSTPPITQPTIHPNNLLSLVLDPPPQSRLPARLTLHITTASASMAPQRKRMVFRSGQYRE